MHHFLLVYQVSCFADKRHERAKVSRPLIENLARIFALSEADYASWTIDASKYCLLCHKLRQILLTLLLKTDIQYVVGILN